MADEWGEIEVAVPAEGAVKVEKPAEAPPAEAPANAAPQPAAPAPDTESEAEVEGEALDKKPTRHQRLKAQRDRERQRADEALQLLQAREDQLRQAAAYIAQMSQARAADQNQSVVAYEKRVDDSIEMVKKALKQAKETADIDGEVEAAEKLSQLTWEKKQIGAYKAQQPQRQAPTAPQSQQQEVQHQVSQQTVQADPLAQDWASRNKAWFGGKTMQDRVMTQAALAIDYELQQEGSDPSEEGHYAEVDKQLSTLFPQHFKGASPTLPVAGAPRGPVQGGKVRLSGAEHAMAARLGAPLQGYAENKQRLETATGDNGWTTLKVGK